MSEDEFDALRADIASRGILTPLEITAAGVVVDGLHRLQAAQLLGLEEVPIRSVAPADEVEHILLAALNRRHLSQSQKAALAMRTAGRAIAALVRSPAVRIIGPEHGAAECLTA